MIKKYIFLSLAAIAINASANIRTITDGNFVFKIDDEQGTATLLSVVDTSVSTLEIPTVAHEGNHTKYLVNSLGNTALNGCSNVSSLVIPGSIHSIYQGAFLGCTSLTHIEFAPGEYSLVILSEWGAQDEKDLLADAPLQSVSFSRRSSYITIYHPFKGKTTITEAYIGKEAGSVPKGIFTDCSNLASVVLEEGLTEIQQYAFRGCTSLNEITLPSTVATAGIFAFEGCSALTSINIPAALKVIPERFLDDCISLTSIVMPEGVEAIDEFAFYNCSGLTYLSIPSTVSEIGDEAFRDCTSLATIDCDIVVPPAISARTFYRVNTKTCRLNVPEASLAAYKAAPYWKEFFTEAGIETISGDTTEAQWYTLDGIALPQVPSAPGIYIVKTAEGSRTTIVR